MNKKIWMGIITHENEMIFAKGCASKRKAESAIVKYIKDNEGFDGKDFAEVCLWIGENDLRFDLMVFDLESKDFDAVQFKPGYIIEPPPKEKGLYRVVYAIDVDAPDQAKAAEKVWHIMHDKDSFDPILVVIDSKGKRTEFDMSHVLEFNKITVGFVSQKYRKDSNGKFKCILQDFIAGDDVQYENVLGEKIEEQRHEYQSFNMSFLSTAQIINRLGDVLTSIDVGGEQSRQFAHEIQILDALLKDLGWSKD